MVEQRIGHSPRRHQRIRAPLEGHYILADGRKARCTLIDVSSAGMAIAASEQGRVGQSVVLHLDDIGRVQGKIVRLTSEGFAVQLDAGAAGSGRVADWFAGLHASGGADRLRQAEAALAQRRPSGGLRPSDGQALRRLELQPASEAARIGDVAPPSARSSRPAAFAAGAWSALRIVLYLACVWVLASHIWGDLPGLLDDRSADGARGLLPLVPDCCFVFPR